MIDFLIYLIFLMCFLNFIILIALGVFVVQFRDRINELFSDLLESLFGYISEPQLKNTEQEKTWDQKYEEDLENMTRRIRANSGLKDLPDPTLSWGEPPAPNPQKDLFIKQK